MVFVQPGPVSTSVFVLTLVFVISCLIAAVYIANQRLGGPARARTTKAAVGMTLWLILTGCAVQSGLLERSPVPWAMLFFVSANLVAILFALSAPGRWIATGLPIAWLVAFQGFRLPLELVLHEWASAGVIPIEMTWSGSNFDIVSGVVALIAAPFANRLRSVAWLANLVGFALLLNVIRVAILTSPLPFAWPVDPPLQLIFHLPYAWIGPICVAGAFSGHVILTRALLTRSTSNI